MNAGEILKNVENEERVYSSEAYNLDNLQAMVDLYQKKHGGDWSRGWKLLSCGEADVYQTQHLVKHGGHGLGSVEKAFNVTLPEWAHSFYEEVDECTLSLRNIIAVMSANEIVDFERSLRDLHPDKEQINPVRIIRFAQVVGESNAFAFRRSVGDDKWRITFISSVDDRLESFYSKEFDGHEDDENIDAWMKRMIETDGFPLIAGDDFGSDYAAIRLK